MNALARRIGVGWHTWWDALKVEARGGVDDLDRFARVESLGVGEHVWRPGKVGAGARCLPGGPDLRRQRAGQGASARPGPWLLWAAYLTWLDTRPEPFRVGIKHAALDPFRGYANLLRDSLPAAVQVLDAFHVATASTNAKSKNSSSRLAVRS